MTVITFAEARQWVEPSNVPVQKRGILKVAEVIPADSHTLMGVETVTDACAEGKEWASICYNVDGVFCGPGTTAPSLVKTFETIDQLEGSPFAVYAGVDCRRLGAPWDEETRARKRLDYAEGRLVDDHMQTLFNATALDLTPVPGTPLSIVEAVGTLENYASQVYGGVPYIHGIQSTITCGHAATVFDMVDGEIRTLNGSIVSNLSTPAPVPTTKYLYVTGFIRLFQGPVMSFDVPEVFRNDAVGDPICDPARALAERIYVPLIECLAARVEVDC